MFRRKKKTPTVESPVKDKVAGKIVTATLKIQQHWAAAMQSIAERIPVKKRKWMVILFILIGGGYSFYLIASSLSGSHHQGLKITSIKTPKYITNAGDSLIQSAGLIPESEYKKIKQFKNYMDSLNKSVAGKRIADSIMKARPGLLDSVIKLEAIYHLQAKSNK